MVRDSVEDIVKATRAIYDRWDAFFAQASADKEALTETANQLHEVMVAAQQSETQTRNLAKQLAKLSSSWKK